MMTRFNIDIFESPELMYNNNKYFIKKFKKYIRKGKKENISRHEIYKLFKNIKELVPNDETYKKLEKEIDGFTYYNKSILEKDKIIFTLNDRILAIIIKNNKMEIVLIKENYYKKEVYRLYDDNYTYKKQIVNFDRHICEIQNKIIYNIEKEKNIKIFNRNGYQLFNYKEVKNKKFSIENKTKDKNIIEQNLLDSYTTKDYFWRDLNNNLVKKSELIYENDKDKNREYYFMGINKTNSKNINISVPFIYLDKKTYQMYMDKKCDQEYLYKNIGNTYVKKRK